MIELTLTDMAHGGDAIGRHEGKAVFVPLGIPGERVAIEITREARRFSRGRIVQVLEPSPDRVDPRCPHYARCGGCHLQHIAYARQLTIKKDIVRTQLRRIAQIEAPLVLASLGMADPWGYRNHVQLRVSPRGEVGYYARGTHNVVPVDHCPIAHPLLHKIWPERASRGTDRVVLRAGANTREQLVMLEGKRPRPQQDWPSTGVSLVSHSRTQTLTVRGESFFHEKLLGRQFRVSAESFFQNNTTQAERMIHLVGETMALQPHETLLDAYCGAGAFGLSLADQCAQVWGIESAPSSLNDARGNRGDTAMRFLRGRVGPVLAQRKLLCDAVVLDPPRAGCSPEAIAGITKTGAQRIAYVSCDPATQARDIRLFVEHGFRLVSAQPIDMFPQTFHIETVAFLER